MYVGAIFTLYQHAFGVGCHVCEGFRFAGITVELRKEFSCAQLQLYEEFSVCISNGLVGSRKHMPQGSV